MMLRQKLASVYAFRVSPEQRKMVQSHLQRYYLEGANARPPIVERGDKGGLIGITFDYDKKFTSGLPLSQT